MNYLVILVSVVYCEVCCDWWYWGVPAFDSIEQFADKWKDQRDMELSKAGNV